MALRVSQQDTALTNKGPGVRGEGRVLCILLNSTLPVTSRCTVSHFAESVYNKCISVGNKGPRTPEIYITLFDILIIKVN
jgi:hypothetical protein